MASLAAPTDPCGSPARRSIVASAAMRTRRTGRRPTARRDGGGSRRWRRLPARGVPGPLPAPESVLSPEDVGTCATSFRELSLKVSRGQGALRAGPIRLQQQPSSRDDRQHLGAGPVGVGTGRVQPARCRGSCPARMSSCPGQTLAIGVSVGRSLARARATT